MKMVFRQGLLLEKRKPGQAGKAGVRSNHVYGNAVDIVPVEGQTFD
jgi:hypothetical protein